MSGRLAGRFIGLGVTGSIAAYKAVEILRLLRAEGAEVQVLFSNGASRFVAPLTFEALSRRRVDADVLDLLPDGRIGHIIVADAADAVLVAPASAAWLSAMADGLASDTVTATCLATSAPVVVAPAMDGDMWSHPATRSNVARLRDEFGYAVVDPETGPLASGQSGPGRLAALPAIVDAVVQAVERRPIRAADASALPPTIGEVRDADLLGRRIVVSAGGTAEPIDPVRYIGNRSTGRMGIAVAHAARDRGADVTLVVGTVSVPLPDGVRIVRVETAAEMGDALVDALAGDDGRAGFDALVMAAAVADFRPRSESPTKLARADGLTLDLVPTTDILAGIARRARGHDPDGTPARAALDPRPVLVGFAAETGSLGRAADKLVRKGVDLLVANDVAEAGSGFGTETNRVTFLSQDGTTEALPLLPKREVADRILDRVQALLDVRDRNPQTGVAPGLPNGAAPGGAGWTGERR